MPCIDTGRISLFVEDTGSGGVPVLLLHELGGSNESWREVIPLLAADRRVIAVDLRCAGRSEKPPGAFTLADAVDDLDALLPALGLDQPVDVIGAALGSVVAALLAIRHPTRVRRLMMCAVAPDMAGPTRTYVAERRRRCGRRHARGGGREPGELLSAVSSDATAAYRGIYLGNDPAAYANCRWRWGAWR